MGKKGLGRGLQALIPSNGGKFDSDSGEKILEIDVENIFPSSRQPRKQFDHDKIRELAKSIKEHGVLQPIVVRKGEGGKFEIIVGERRWRASKLAGLTYIPCMIKDFSDREASELALIENMQRENLNPLEEAEGFQRLINEFGYTQEELAGRLGKSRPYIANTLRLINLSPPLQSFIREGVLSPGHARAVLAVKGDRQLSLAEKIISQKMSVRQAEELAREIRQSEEKKKDQKSQTKNRKEPKKEGLSVELNDIENRLRTALGTRVKVKLGKKGGRIEIEFYSEEELDRIIEIVLGDEVV